MSQAAIEKPDARTLIVSPRGDVHLWQSHRPERTFCGVAVRSKRWRRVSSEALSLSCLRCNDVELAAARFIDRAEQALLRCNHAAKVKLGSSLIMWCADCGAVQTAPDVQWARPHSRNRLEPAIRAMLRESK